MGRVFLFISLLSLLSSGGGPQKVAGNARIGSFDEAKRLLGRIYEGDQKEFYCGCPFRGKTVDIDTCGYRPRGNARRARRIEWEHVVPAHAFGQSFREWREGHPTCVGKRGKAFKGRKCAAKASEEFRRMEADLYNLRPAIGEINNLRGNKSMAEIPGEAREFGTCDAEIAGNKFEPREAIRGDVARIYLYMDAAYPGRGIVSDKNRKLFEAWDKLDPVDAEECGRYAELKALQGNAHPILESRCEPALAARP